MPDEAEYWRCPGCGHVEETHPHRPGVARSNTVLGATAARGPRDLHCGHCGHVWRMPAPDVWERHQQRELLARLRSIEEHNRLLRGE